MHLLNLAIFVILFTNNAIHVLIKLCCKNIKYESNYKYWCCTMSEQWMPDHRYLNINYQILKITMQWKVYVNFCSKSIQYSLLCMYTNCLNMYQNTRIILKCLLFKSLQFSSLLWLTYGKWRWTNLYALLLNHIYATINLNSGFLIHVD